MEEGSKNKLMLVVIKRIGNYRKIKTEGLRGKREIIMSVYI